MASLLEEIHELELQHKQHLGAAIFQSLQQKIFKLYALLDQTYVKHKEYTQHMAYEYGNKCSKALTRSISKTI